jgi:putative oxidoreductase
MKALVLIGRIFFSWIFLYTITGHFSESTIGYAESKGVPFASIAVPLSGVIAVLGGLSILFGYKAKIGGWLVVLFLVPITLIMHNFWAIADPAASQTQLVAFNKNLAMLGGALLITYFGSGPLSIDVLMNKKKTETSAEKTSVRKTSREEALPSEKRDTEIKHQKDKKKIR